MELTLSISRKLDRERTDMYSQRRNFSNFSFQALIELAFANGFTELRLSSETVSDDSLEQLKEVSKYQSLTIGTKAEI